MSKNGVIITSRLVARLRASARRAQGTILRVFSVPRDEITFVKLVDSLPRNYSKFYTVEDANGTDILDYSRMPSPFVVTLELRIYNAICGQEKFMGEGGHPPVMPIKRGHPVVYAKNAEQGLLPTAHILSGSCPSLIHRWCFQREHR